MEIASVYEQALKCKKGTPLKDNYLIFVVIDCDEPLALSLWPNLSGFLVRAVFGVPKCLFNSYWVGEAFHIFADDVLYQ